MIRRLLLDHIPRRARGNPIGVENRLSCQAGVACFISALYDFISSCLLLNLPEPSLGLLKFLVVKSKGSGRFVASYVARECEERLLSIFIDTATELGD